MVRLLTSVVIVLLISHAPRTSLNLYESYNIGTIGPTQIQSLFSSKLYFKKSRHVRRYLVQSIKVMFGKLPEQPFWAGVLIKTSHLLLTLSSAVNILIYYFKVIEKSSKICGNVIGVTAKSGIALKWTRNRFLFILEAMPMHL